MRFLLIEHYRTAKQSLDRSPARTLLTILGVSIGVASVTAILALSAGITQILSSQVEALGNNIAVVRPKATSTGLADLSNPTGQIAYSTSPIAERDLEIIKNDKRTKAAAPLMAISGSIRTDDTLPEQSTLLATTPSFEQIEKLKLREGQFIDSVTLEDTVVVGSQLSIDLFGTQQSIGKNMLIKGKEFTVIGVLDRQNNPVNYNNIDLDQTAIISFDSGKLFNGGVAQIQQINLTVKPDNNLAKYSKDIADLLQKNHDGQPDVSVFTGKSIAQPTNQAFSLVSSAMAVIAGISLIVGGIGIMNIMLVGITERTREIGLRKAVGASNTTIIAQFLIEALIMSFLGGLLGFIGGYVFAFIISVFIPYDPSISWNVVGWAFGLSIIVGIVFGIYPAYRAARKDPIESLRRYH